MHRMVRQGFRDMASLFFLRIVVDMEIIYGDVFFLQATPMLITYFRDWIVYGGRFFLGYRMA